MTSRFGPTLRFKDGSHALSAGSIAEVNRDGALLKRVDKNRVLSGIGEGPAIVHLRKGACLVSQRDSDVLRQSIARHCFRHAAKGIGI